MALTLPRFLAYALSSHTGHWAGKARVGWSTRAPDGRMHEHLYLPWGQREVREWGDRKSIGLTGFCFKLSPIFFNPGSQSIMRSPYLAISLAKVQEGHMRCSAVLFKHPAPTIPSVTFSQHTFWPVFTCAVSSPQPVLSYLTKP